MSDILPITRSLHLQIADEINRRLEKDLERQSPRVLQDDHAQDEEASGTVRPSYDPTQRPVSCQFQGRARIDHLDTSYDRGQSASQVA